MLGVLGGLCVVLTDGRVVFSHTHRPPKRHANDHPNKDVADACRTGAATDIIFGLALGYKSCIIPCFVIALAIYVSNSLAGMYGIACTALGMLTPLSTGLAIDAYGPISDNAGGERFVVCVRRRACVCVWVCVCAGRALGWRLAGRRRGEGRGEGSVRARAVLGGARRRERGTNGITPISSCRHTHTHTHRSCGERRLGRTRTSKSRAVATRGALCRRRRRYALSIDASAPMAS